MQGVFAVYLIRGMIVTPIYPMPNKDVPNVSVIICAKNEAENLKRFLPAILEQDYDATYDVIVINDNSTDASDDALQVLEKRYPHLRHISTEDGISGKKLALEMGVRNAHHEYLLFTDADCVPASKYWLQCMVAPLVAGKEIVAGFGEYTNDGGLLHSFISWETLHTFMQFAGYAGNGLPYMATGRNLACTRLVIEKAIENPLWQKLSSGHDDLIVQVSGRRDNTVVVFDKHAHTISTPKNDWKEWALQKQRHVTTGKHYRPLVKYMLGLYALTHAAVWLLFIPLIFTANAPVVILLFVFRSLLFSAAFTMAAIKTKHRIRGVLMYIGDLGWMIYNFAFLPYIAWKNKTNWK